MRRPTMSSATATSPSSPTRLTCTVCAHDWGAHDPVGARYCTATAAGGLSRQCVCTEEVALFGAQPR